MPSSGDSVDSAQLRLFATLARQHQQLLAGPARAVRTASCTDRGGERGTLLRKMQFDSGPQLVSTGSRHLQVAVLEHHAELIAFESSQHAASSNCQPENLADRDQCAIACIAVDVVHERFKAVHVHNEHR